MLIPGIYSTRLKVRINCKELRRDEESLYNKIKLYCNKYVCSSDNDQEENRDLWFNLQAGKSDLHYLKNFMKKYQIKIKKKILKKNRKKIQKKIRLL